MERWATRHGIQWYLMSEISEADMDRLLSDRKTSSVATMPVHYDSKGRIWPHASDGWKVTDKFKRSEEFVR